MGWLDLSVIVQCSPKGFKKFLKRVTMLKSHGKLSYHSREVGMFNAHVDRMLQFFTPTDCSTSSYSGANVFLSGSFEHRKSLHIAPKVICLSRREFIHSTESGSKFVADQHKTQFRFV
jgi:hypothetical protein